MTEDGIKKLAEEGKICEVFNHRWVDIEISIRINHLTKNYLGELVNVRPASMRKCDICGETQVTLPKTWEPYRAEI